MSEFYESYLVLPSGTELTTERIYQPNGETKTVATKVPVMVDAVEEGGNPTGDQQFSHYELDHDNTVEIDLYTGGWATSADNGDMIAIVISTAEVLDELAAEDGVVEVERMAKNGEAVELETEPQIVSKKTGKKIKGRGNDKPDNPNKPTDEEKAAKKAEKNKKLRDKDMEEIPEDINEPEETINFVFQQVDPGYKYGKVNLG